MRLLGDDPTQCRSLSLLDPPDPGTSSLGTARQAFHFCRYRLEFRALGRSPAVQDCDTATDILAKTTLVDYRVHPFVMSAERVQDLPDNPVFLVVVECHIGRNAPAERRPGG